MNDDGIGHFIMIYHFEKYIVVYKWTYFHIHGKKTSGRVSVIFGFAEKVKFKSNFSFPLSAQLK